MPAVAGGEHTLHLHQHKIHSTGACGLGWCRLQPLTPSLLTQYRPVPIPEPIGQIHASYYHNLAVTTTGKHLYSWGCGTFVDGGGDGVIPALGGCTEDRGGPPQKVPLPPPLPPSDVVRQITGGAYHSAVLYQSGRLLTFGAGQLGQLGRGLREKDSSGLPIDPQPRAVEGVPDVETIDRIGAGFYNTFAVCRSGKMFCAGENQNRQCGIGPKNLQRMTEVAEVGDDVGEVEGGYCHTLVRTIHGKVYSMGCGDDGQRGDGLIDEEEEEKQRSVVTEVRLPTKASSVSAGANHSVVLGTDGNAYTFGANDVGQCGVVVVTSGDDDDDDDEGGPVLQPTKVKLPEDAGRVTHVSAGYAHTVLTTESERVFVFGQNDNGQLGLRAGGVNGKDLAEAQTVPVETMVPGV